MEDNKDIKDIIPVKLTIDIDNNIKLIKRKLNIYNLKNGTNYSLEELGIDIIYNRYQNITSLFYFYKELNKDFDYNLLDIYKENYFKASKFFKDILKKCKIYERKDDPNSLFLFKKEFFVLEQDFKNKEFRLSYPLIWTKIQSDFDYKWLEISNLCNGLLEQSFKERGFTTFNTLHCYQLKDSFQQNEFIIKNDVKVNLKRNPSEYAKLFDEHFTNDKYKTSSDNNFRIRYEVCMPQIDYWINSFNLDISNDFNNDGQKFKNNLFYHLKKMNWKPTKIKGRWSKTIFI